MPPSTAARVNGHVAIALDAAVLDANGDDIAKLQRARAVTIVATKPSTLPPMLKLFLAATKPWRTAKQQPASDRALVERTEPVDLLIDLSGESPPAAAAGRSWHVTYNDVAGDAALYTSLLSGADPTVEIVDSATGAVLASGNPCTNDATNLQQAAAFVRSRAIALIQMALEGRPPNLSRVPSAAHQIVTGPSTALILTTAARNVVHSSVRAVYRSLFYSPQWHVGYRMIGGTGVLESASLAGEAWRIVPEVEGHFYADPMPIQVNGQYYLFFEDLDHRTNKGVISYLRVAEDGSLGPVQLALEELHHLSYPFLIEDGGDIYMLPEQSASGRLTLYRATRFPDGWVPDTVLLDGVDVNDATIVRHQDRYWMFASVRDGIGSPSDTLAVFEAETLRGPWSAHQSNPILIDKTAARPAGPFVSGDGRLFRVAQDCTYGYGSGVSIVEVTNLTSTSVEQVVLHKVWPGSSHWMGKRLHTLARAGQLECIDGSGVSPRSSLLKMLLRFGPLRRLLYGALGV